MSRLGEWPLRGAEHITDKRITRLVFFQHEASLIIVAGFIKKSQSTPDDVLKLSRKRKSEFERNAPKSKKK